jgi:hypothetical protein
MIISGDLHGQYQQLHILAFNLKAIRDGFNALKNDGSRVCLTLSSPQVVPLQTNLLPKDCQALAAYLCMWGYLKTNVSRHTQPVSITYNSKFSSIMQPFLMRHCNMQWPLCLTNARLQRW